MSIYYADLQKIPSKSFTLHPLLMPTSHFHTLFYCNSTTFLLSHCWFPSRTITYFHSHPHSSISKLFIYFLLALKYTTFSFSIFFSWRFRTSFFCLFVASYQRLLLSCLLSPNRSFYYIAPPFTLWALSLPASSYWTTHFSRSFNHCSFHVLPHMLNIIISILFYSLPL